MEPIANLLTSSYGDIFYILSCPLTDEKSFYCGTGLFEIVNSPIIQTCVELTEQSSLFKLCELNNLY